MHPADAASMPYSPDQARKALANFMDIHNLSARALCKAADLSPSALSQFMSGRVHSLKSSTYEALAVGAGRLLNRSVSTGELRGDSPESDIRVAELQGVRKAQGITVPYGAEMHRDLPILGTVSAGPGGLSQMENGTPVDFARRPPRLVGRTDVFGLFIEDSSMIPAHMPGSLIICEKARPPSAGDDVVFELLPESARHERRAMIKRLIALTPTLLKVQQFNPPKVLEFPRKQIENLHRVMPLTDLLGI